MKIDAPDYETEHAAVSEPPAIASRNQGVTGLTLPGVALVLACLVPFLNKAYTIDDPWFLLEARQILKTPLQPMSFPVCWMGIETCLARAGSLGAGTVQGLMGYLLVPVILAGGAEWIAHLLQIVLGCVAIVELVRISLRLGFNRFQARIAGLLLVSIPPFFSMASTAMPDIAALAFGLTGMERLLAWKDERRWHLAAAAGFALGLASYARPHMALLLPLGALWLFPDLGFGKALTYFRKNVWLWTPILVAACVLAGVNWLTRDRGPAYEARNILTGPQNIPRNLFAYLHYLAFPIPLAAVWIAAHWRKAMLLIVLPSALAVPLILLLKNVAPAWQIAAALYAAAALVHMVCWYARAGDRLGILLSLWVLIPAPFVLYIHFPIKYMMAVLPAIVLIVVRTLSTQQRPRAIAVYGTLVLAGAAYSCLLLRADADFAEYGRRAAAEMIAPHVAAGEKVWFGGEWGFYWYAQEAGARISIPGHPGPNPGELLAVGLEEGGGVTLDRFPRRRLIDSRHYDSPHGRTMGYGAGLYSNRSGDALWVWKPESVNTYELWRVY